MTLDHGMTSYSINIIFVEVFPSIHKYLFNILYYVIQPRNSKRYWAVFSEEVQILKWILTMKLHHTPKTIIFVFVQIFPCMCQDFTIISIMLFN